MTHPQPNPLRLYAFDGGRILTQAVRFIAADGSETVRDMADPNHAYLIEHPNGRLMWDAGLSDTIAGLPEQTRTSGRFKFQVTDPLAAQFERLGLDPAQIDYLAFSHLQVDHAGNTALFTRAAALLRPAEYRHACGPQAGDWGYIPADYAALHGRQTTAIRGDYDVFGDGSVIILSAPGHTPGHQVLYVNLPQTGPVILSGDLYYTSADVAAGRMPAWNYNHPQTRRTMRRLARFAAARGARWLINHAPDSPPPGWMG